jgi:hypothetical protein
MKYPGLNKKAGVEMSFERLHWGLPSDFTQQLRYASGEPAQRLGHIRAISYVTRKGSEIGVYEHHFDAPDGKLPRLLRLHAKGTARTYRTDERQPLVLGRVIDIVMDDGQVILPTMTYILVERRSRYQGSPVILASRHAVPLAIEHRVWQGKLLPYVVEHGIVG